MQMHDYHDYAPTSQWPCVLLDTHPRRHNALKGRIRECLAAGLAVYAIVYSTLWVIDSGISVSLCSEGLLRELCQVSNDGVYSRLFRLPCNHDFAFLVDTLYSWLL